MNELILEVGQVIRVKSNVGGGFNGNKKFRWGYSFYN